MPLPLTVSCFSKIQIGFTFLVLAHLGSPGQGAVKWVCVCVCVCMLLFYQLRSKPQNTTDCSWWYLDIPSNQQCCYFTTPTCYYLSRKASLPIDQHQTNLLDEMAQQLMRSCAATPHPGTHSLSIVSSQCHSATHCVVIVVHEYCVTKLVMRTWNMPDKAPSMMRQTGSHTATVSFTSFSSWRRSTS